MYKPTDFNLTNAPEEMVQYVIDNVEDFESRYKHAMGIMDRYRCSLYQADCSLYDDIHEAMAMWAIENSNFTDEEFEEFDIEAIFG